LGRYRRCRKGQGAGIGQLLVEAEIAGQGVEQFVRGARRMEESEPTFEEGRVCYEELEYGPGGGTIGVASVPGRAGRIMPDLGSGNQ
jgi:hypothetical protein